MVKTAKKAKQEEAVPGLVFAEIEMLTKEYAEAYDAQKSRCDELREDIRTVKRKALRRIKVGSSVLAEKTTALKRLITTNPQLFEKPRTVTLHGIKVGLEKGKGNLQWDDVNQVLKLIRKNFPEQADVLITTTEKPNSALKGLSVGDLKKLAVEVVDTGDRVVIKVADTWLDKFVKAILKEEEDLLEEKEAA